MSTMTIPEAIADLQKRVAELEAAAPRKPGPGGIIWRQTCPGCGGPLHDERGSIGRLFGTLPDGSTWHSLCYENRRHD